MEAEEPAVAATADVDIGDAAGSLANEGVHTAADQYADTLAQDSVGLNAVEEEVDDGAGVDGSGTVAVGMQIEPGPVELDEDMAEDVFHPEAALAEVNDENIENRSNELQRAVSLIHAEVRALINDIRDVDNLAGNIIWQSIEDVVEDRITPNSNDVNALEPSAESNVEAEANMEDAAENAQTNNTNGDGNGEAGGVGAAPEVDVNGAGGERRSSSSNSSMSMEFSDSEDDLEAPPRWLIPQQHVNAAIRELVSQARQSEGGIAALLNRDNFMQRVRSLIFSWERNRRLRRGQIGAQSLNEEEDSSNEEERLELSDRYENALQYGGHIEVDDGMNAVRFDTNLPAEHSYFGANLNRVPGVNYLDVGGTYRMLVFMHQHLLFPGEVLPFMINGSIIDEEIENGAWSGREGIIFGVVFPSVQEPGGNPLKLYGVTCQIYEKGEDGREMVFYKSRALQRFIVNCDDLHGPPQYIATNPKAKCHGIVKILPEIYLPEPLNCVNMGTMNRFRDSTYMQDKFKRFQAATTPWPDHVYNEYSISQIIEKARKQLEKHKIDTMPTCPIQLSFWLVRNLHFTEKLMHTIFMTDSVNVRMKIIGRTFKQNALKETLFTCRTCNNNIAHCHELFAMSKHGVQTQYCNSAGYIHETNTVYRLVPDCINYSGEPSTEFSWFPGYQWRIIVCKYCTQHIGWEYTATVPNLVPRSFFGLAGSSVRISKATNNTVNNMRPFVYRNLLRLVTRSME